MSNISISGVAMVGSNNKHSHKKSHIGLKVGSNSMLTANFLVFVVRSGSAISAESNNEPNLHKLVTSLTNEPL